MTMGKNPKMLCKFSCKISNTAMEEKTRDAMNAASVLLNHKHNPRIPVNSCFMTRVYMTPRVEIICSNRS